MGSPWLQMYMREQKVTCMHGFGQKLHNCITALHLYVLHVDLPDRLGV